MTSIVICVEADEIAVKNAEKNFSSDGENPGERGKVSVNHMLVILLLLRLVEPFK